MNRVQEIYDVTKQFASGINDKVNSSNRDEVIERINEYVERRGELMKDLTPPFTEEENRLGKELVALNRVVEGKMDVLFKELKEEMKQVKKQKKSNRTYMNPYENVSTLDGRYVDSKK